MKRNTYCKFLLLVVFTLSVAFGCKEEIVNNPDYAAQMKSISFLTENYPPFNYEFEGEIYGVSTDILQGLFVEMNISAADISLELNDWETVYQQTLNEPNTMLYSVVRIPERENLFKWVGPIAPQKDVIIALGSQQKTPMQFWL